MSDYGLIRPFGIDDGELDGETPQECFVLGYELATIDGRIERCEPIVDQLVHAANRDRIESQLRRAGITRFSFTFMPDDPSEGWATLNVPMREEGGS